MSDTIFTKIINGEIPSYKVYEDSHTYAFLDINPVQPGHVLVVPKTPAPTIWELGSADYEALMATVKMLGAHLQKTLDGTHVGIKVEGLQVPHAHVHLIPFTTHEQFEAAPTSDISQSTLEDIAKKLAI